MSKLDYGAAKAEISKIVEIVKSVPENLQVRCFELLFNAAFESKEKKKTEKDNVENHENKEEAPQEKSRQEPLKLPGNVLGLMRRNSISHEELGRLFMLEHEPLLPVYKLPTGNLAKAQLMKVLMLLLENGLLNNSLSAPYAEVRSTLKEEGLYDSNFNKVLKKNHTYFKGAISKNGIDESGVVDLTGPGMEKLAEVIKELGQ